MQDCTRETYLTSNQGNEYKGILYKGADPTFKVLQWSHRVQILPTGKDFP